MKKKLLHTVGLLFFSITVVFFLFNVVLVNNIDKLLPSKISPQNPTEEYIPKEKNKYSPHELQRIYLFEHIHRSVQREKKGITS